MALFDCTCDAKSGNARALTFTTAHGDFHTPMFMPVGTSATVKGITPPQLRELKSQVVLANTYHLSQRPGEDVVAQAGGVHKFMNYDGPMLTDSGGFQIFSLADTRKLDNDGVTFRSIYDGSYVRWTPEENMRSRKRLAPTSPCSSTSARRTLRRASSSSARSICRLCGRAVAWRRTSGPIRRSSASFRAA